MKWNKKTKMGILPAVFSVNGIFAIAKQTKGVMLLIRIGEKYDCVAGYSSVASAKQAAETILEAMVRPNTWNSGGN